MDEPEALIRGRPAPTNAAPRFPSGPVGFAGSAQRITKHAAEFSAVEEWLQPHGFLPAQIWNGKVGGDREFEVFQRVDAPAKPREVLVLEIPDTTMGCFKKLSSGGGFVEPLSLAFTNTSSSGEVEVRFNFLGKQDPRRQIHVNLTLFEAGGRMIFREGEAHEDCRLQPDEIQRSSFVMRFSSSNEAEFKVPMGTLRAAVRTRLEFVHHDRSDDGSRVLGQP